MGTQPETVLVSSVFVPLRGEPVRYLRVGNPLSPSWGELRVCKQNAREVRLTQD